MSISEFSLSEMGPGAMGEAPPVNPWNTVASYGTYGEAQAAVDRLVSIGFPVEYLEIVGSKLRLVEQVTGRMTAGRAIAAGAGVGAWWGLLIGMVVGIFSTAAAWLGLVLGGLVLGAAWGALIGLVARWYSHGRHNFSSLRGVVATQYDIIAREGMAYQARQALGLA
jgi:hypothetical protein